jgi:hypothetical protein
MFIVLFVIVEVAIVESVEVARFNVELAIVEVATYEPLDTFE